MRKHWKFGFHYVIVNLRYITLTSKMLRLLTREITTTRKVMKRIRNEIKTTMMNRIFVKIFQAPVFRLFKILILRFKRIWNALGSTSLLRSDESDL